MDLVWTTAHDFSHSWIKMLTQVQSNPAEQARRNIESAFTVVRDGGRHAVRRTGRAAHAVVSSKWVQRFVVGTTLLSIVGALLYIPAALGYLLLYYKFLPQLETYVPVHLQYG
jgi:seipin